MAAASHINGRHYDTTHYDIIGYVTPRHTGEMEEEYGLINE